MDSTIVAGRTVPIHPGEQIFVHFTGGPAVDDAGTYAFWTLHADTGTLVYCPTAAVTRDQMAVFISVTFGLTLYGP